MRKRDLLLGSRRPRPLGAIGPHSDGLKLKLGFLLRASQPTQGCYALAFGSRATALTKSSPGLFTRLLLRGEVAHRQCASRCGIDQTSPMIEAGHGVLFGAEGEVQADCYLRAACGRNED